MVCSVPEELDETDLMDELNAMEGELEQEMDSQEVPSYLLNAATAAKQTVPSSSSSSAASKHEQKSAYPDVEVDEFGLPSVPVRSLEA